MLEIQIANNQDRLDLNLEQIRGFAEHVLRQEAVLHADISLAFVNDRSMIQLHQQYLNINSTTDVLSFPLSDSETHLEGEVVVNTCQAYRIATQNNWSPTSEMLLYTVHGLLHLCGFDDHTENTSRIMQDRQTELLKFAGISPTFDQQLSKPISLTTETSSEEL